MGWRPTPPPGRWGTRVPPRGAGGVRKLSAEIDEQALGIGREGPNAVRKLTWNAPPKRSREAPRILPKASRNDSQIAKNRGPGPPKSVKIESRGLPAAKVTKIPIFGDFLGSPGDPPGMPKGIQNRPGRRFWRVRFLTFFPASLFFTISSLFITFWMTFGR